MLPEGSLIWEYENSYKVEKDENGLRKNKKIKYKIEIPYIQEKNLHRLYQGKTYFIFSLKKEQQTKR